MPPLPDDDDLTVPAMDHMGGHKESQYTPQMGVAIVVRMAQGLTIRQIAADPAMPSYATIFHWRKLHEDFAWNWELVRRMQAAVRVGAWESRPKRTRPGGKKSSFTVERGEAVCAWLREGVAMSAINAMPGMPSARVVYTWLKREPAFRAMVDEAREYGLRILGFHAEAAAEEAMPSFKDGEFTPGPKPLAVAKAEFGYFMGRIGRLTPKVYGRFRMAPPKAS